MIIATPVGQPPRLLGGPPQLLGGHGIQGDGYTWLRGLSALPAGYSSQYQAFQQALVSLSNALGDSRINPGSTDGILDNGLPSNATMGALVAALPHLKSKLGTATTTILTLALAFGASTTKAKTTVRDYMATLTGAINAVAAVAAGSGGGSTSTAIALNTPWYKTWWGAGGLVLGAVGLIWLISSRRSAAA